MKNIIAAFAVSLLALTATAHNESTPIAGHIVFIGLDGLAANGFDKAEMPVVKSLMEQGCYTMQKRAVLPSKSAVNWASMWMGAGPELHGYTAWDSSSPDLPSRVILKNGIFPTVFQIVRDARPDAEIGVFAEWDVIKCLVDSLSLNHFEEIPDHKVNNTMMCDHACRYIVEKRPTLLTVVYNNPDVVGHESGWYSDDYYACLPEIDAYIGRIIEATKEAGIYDDTVFIVTSDHGGHDKDHGSISMLDMETPFVIAGKGIRRGGEFSESMMQYDVAPTMTHILGIRPEYIPQVWIGRPMLQVFK